jgi:hypothetical protein
MGESSILRKRQSHAKDPNAFPSGHCKSVQKGNARAHGHPLRASCSASWYERAAVMASVPAMKYTRQFRHSPRIYFPLHHTQGLWKPNADWRLTRSFVDLTEMVGYFMVAYMVPLRGKRAVITAWLPLVDLCSKSDLN